MLSFFIVGIGTYLGRMPIRSTEPQKGKAKDFLQYNFLTTLYLTVTVPIKIELE